MSKGNVEVAVRLEDSPLTLRHMEDVLSCKEKTQDLLKKNNEAMLQFVEDIKNLRNLILNEITHDNAPSMVSAVGGVGQGHGAAGESMPSQAPVMGNNRENILRKALKCKQLEDDNKKLRKLLKTQIDNSEQLRQDTQNTIETLREDFDILMKELLQYKQRDEKQGATSKKFT